MQSQNGPNIKKQWAIGLSSVLAVALGLMQPAQAVEFPDAGDRGAPSRTAGGGTRGEWCEGNEWSEWSARALVPSNNVSTFSSEQASLWLHVSESFNNKTAEIYIQDVANNEAIYEQQIELTGLYENSLVKVDLPELTAVGTPLLEPGQEYYWDFSIICDPNNRAQDYVTQGLLHRVEADAELIETLNAASPLQQLEEYASAGLWQETLQTAALLKDEQPHLWIDLLSSVGLGMLTEEITIGNQESAYQESPYEESSYEENTFEESTSETNASEANTDAANVRSVGSMAIDR
ncbi:MAG: DUF928 domain-containing protein [Phormidesmis sp.]